MPDENLSPSSWPPKPPQPIGRLGTGEGESPLAPSSSPSDIRTMGSDIASMQKEGGGMPRPYTPRNVGIPPFQKEQEAKEKALEPSEREPSGPLFLDKSDQLPPAPPKESPLAPAKKSNKGLFVTLTIIIVVIGVGAVGYFFIYPIIFKASPPPPNVLPPTAPVVPPTPTVSETTPTSEVTIPFATTTESTTPVGARGAHETLLETATLLTSEVTITKQDMAAVREVIKFTTSETPVLKELVMKDALGKALSFGQVMAIMAPNVFTDEVAKSFEADPTVLSYTDSAGTWLGFVTKLKTGASLDAAKIKVGELEKLTDLNSFFLSDPGQAEVWKGGQANGVATRYITFTQSGAALNYGWLNDHLVISASYSGLKEIVKRLK